MADGKLAVLAGARPSDGASESQRPRRARLRGLGVAAALCRLGAWPAPPVAAAPRKEKPPRTEMTHPCSRVISRNTRKVIEQEVLKPAAKAGVDAWPEGCQFDPRRDMYAYQEKQKQKKRGGASTSHSQWTCGICGKQFKNEHYLDLHMERKHQNTMPSNPICVADFCEAFGSCSKDVGRKKPSTRCNETEMAVHRERCHETLAGCFPLSNAEARMLHAKYSRHYCQVLDCGIRNEQQKETQGEPMPAIVLMVLIVLMVFAVFFMVVCCVDYSDEITQWLVETGLASKGTAKNIIKGREKSRQAMGMDRTKCI